MSGFFGFIIIKLIERTVLLTLKSRHGFIKLP